MLINNLLALTTGAIFFSTMTAALAGDTANTDYSNLVDYGCENGRSMQVHYIAKGEDEYALIITAGKEQTKLNIAQSGSGALYSNGELDWHTKDNEGIFIKKDKTMKCTQKSATKDDQEDEQQKSN